MLDLLTFPCPVLYSKIEKYLLEGERSRNCMEKGFTIHETEHIPIWRSQLKVLVINGIFRVPTPHGTVPNLRPLN